MSTSFESNANSAADNLSHSFSVAVSGVEVEGKERKIFSGVSCVLPCCILGIFDKFILINPCVQILAC
jgi:hypothetical protein